MPTLMPRCLSWWNGRPTSVPLNWCCHGDKEIDGDRYELLDPQRLA